MSSDSIKVLSVNCQGLRGKEKRNDVLHYLGNLGAGIICLQDTHWLDMDLKLIKQLWKGDCVINGKCSNSRGVAILFRSTFEYNIISTFSDTFGNLISVDLSLNDCTVKVINIYAPNSDCSDFFSQIKDLITSSETDHIIVCGDYNLALDPSFDTYQYKHVNNPKSRELLLQLMNTCNMTDVFRYLHIETKSYTWRRKRPMQQACLDYIIVTNGLLDYIDSCQIKPGYRTDHSIVEINLVFCKFTKGKGVWKFNCSLLKDSNYLELVNNLIDLV